MGTREVYGYKLQKRVPHVSDPDKGYKHLLDLREGNVQPHNQSRFFVASCGKHGQLKEIEALQKEIEMP